MKNLAILLIFSIFLASCNSCESNQDSPNVVENTTSSSSSNTIIVVPEPGVQIIKNDEFYIEIPKNWVISKKEESQIILFAGTKTNDQTLVIVKEPSYASSDEFFIKLQRSLKDVGGTIPSDVELNKSGETLIQIYGLGKNVYLVVNIQQEYTVSFVCKYGETLLDNIEKCGKIYKTFRLN